MRNMLHDLFLQAKYLKVNVTVFRYGILLKISKSIAGKENTVREGEIILWSNLKSIRVFTKSFGSKISLGQINTIPQ